MLRLLQTLPLLALFLSPGLAIAEGGDSDEADEDYVGYEKNSCEISDYADELVQSLDSSVDEEETKENSEQKAQAEKPDVKSVLAQLEPYLEINPKVAAKSELQQ